MNFIKKNLFSLIALVLAVVAIFVCFAPFMSSTASIGGLAKGTTTWSGFACMFGGNGILKADSVIGSGTTEVETKLVATALISFILLVVGIAATVINMLVNLSFKRILAFVGMGTLVAAGILLFFTAPTFFGANEVAAEAQKYYSLGAGAVIDAIVLILAGAVEALDIFGIIKAK